MVIIAVRAVVVGFSETVKVSVALPLPDVGVTVSHDRSELAVHEILEITDTDAIPLLAAMLMESAESERSFISTIFVKSFQTPQLD